MEFQKTAVEQIQFSQRPINFLELNYTHRQVQECELISQYLCLKPGTPQFLDQQSQQNFKYAENSENKGSETQSSSQNLSCPKKSAKKTSDFHNFQKHLMTTLKKSIKMKRTTNSDRSRSNIACQLWEYFFTKSKQCKRDLLGLLVGSIGRNEENQQTKTREEHTKMLEYFSEYTQKEISSAQEFLRREVIRQSHKLVQSPSFQNRRISKSEDFKNYFNIFIAGLEDGKHNIRMPKQHKCAQEDPANDFEPRRKHQ